MQRTSLKPKGTRIQVVLKFFDLFLNLTQEAEIIESIQNKGCWRGDLVVCRKYEDGFSAVVMVDRVQKIESSLTEYVVLILDISDHKQLEKELRYHAEIDPLTTLANRKLFFQHLDNAVAMAKRFNYNLALIYLDLDGFKQINDSFGHGQGDNVLIEVARRLKQCIREVDTVARIGGDEFVILLNHTSKAMVNDTAQRVIDSLSLTVKGKRRRIKRFRQHRHRYLSG